MIDKKVSEVIERPDFEYYKKERYKDQDRLKELSEHVADNNIIISEIKEYIPKETKFLAVNYGSQFNFSFSKLM